MRPQTRRRVYSSILLLLLATGCAAGPNRPSPSEQITSPPIRPGPVLVPVPEPARASASTATPALTSSSTAAPETARVPAANSAPAEKPLAGLQGVPVPVWHVGDEWAFRWESVEGQGDYVWRVDRTEMVDGVEHYVVQSGPREIYYRARDLATTLETRDGAVEVRHVPARLSFSWPLAPGAMWRVSNTEEKGAARVPVERTIAWHVEGAERIDVEAGTFDTLRIVARHGYHKGPALMYEMWYAPEAKQWVRLKEHFPSGIRYRELTALSLR